MKKYIFYTTILLFIAFNQALLQAAKKSSHNYLDQSAQKIVNACYRGKSFDFSKTTNICSFLSKNTELATFPANTLVTVCNRQYIKTCDRIYGNWSIVLPEDNDSEAKNKSFSYCFVRQNSKKKLLSIKEEREHNMLSARLRNSQKRASVRRLD